MLKKLLNTKMLKNQKGLTLIELLAVIVILAIVAAIAVPAIGNIVNNSSYNAIKADGINVLNAAQLYYTDNPETTTSITVKGLQDANYLESAGNMPADASVTATKPHKLTGTSKKQVNGHTVSFEGATIDIINADTTKGSSLTTNKVIK